MESMIWLRTAILFSVLLISSWAQAGFVEIGASANYRRSAFNKDNFQELLSYTSSISFYFNENSAIELSYTDGYSELSVKPSDPLDPKTTTETNFTMIGADLVLSFSGRDDALQPYVKIGGGYLLKEVFQQQDNADKYLISHSEGLVPSAGVGFKLVVTKELAVKFGLDAWTTPLQENPVVVDYSGRAGISWMF
jgi:outer membrane protein W